MSDREDDAPETDPLTVLGLALTADDAALRTAYRSAVQAHPPERDPAGFKRVRTAYETLRDPQARARFLLTGRALVPEVGRLDLGVAAPPTPTLRELLAGLRAALLEGSDLARRDFPEDLRDPAVPAGAPSQGGTGRKA